MSGALPPRRVQDLLPVKRDRFGLRTRARFSPTLFGDVAARLRLLGESAETASARAEVDAALASPWWGFRSLAIQVIGGWGGARSKAWLVQRAGRVLPSRRAAMSLARGDDARWRRMETVMARGALVRHLDAGDAGWLLDLWFADWDSLLGLMSAVVERLPRALVDARIAQELRRGDPGRREALLWLVIAHRALPDRDEVLRRFAGCEDRRLARLAGRALEWSRSNVASKEEA